MIELQLIHLYNAVTQLLKAARFNRGRLLLAPYKEDSIMVATGSPDSYVGVWFVKAEYESFAPVFVDADGLYAFLSASHSESTLKIDPGNPIIATCGRNKRRLPYESGSYFKIFEPESFVTVLPHKEFINLARVAYMAADQGDHRAVYTGAYLMIDEKFIRLVAADGFASGYSWYERRSNETSESINTLIPAVSLQAVIGMSWEDNISIYQDSSGKLFFVSDRFYVYCTPLAEKEKYPAQLLINALGSDLHSTVYCDPFALIDKLTACSRVKSQYNTPRVRFDTDVQDGTLKVWVREKNDQMDFYINLLKHSGADLSFIVDGRFVSKAISLLQKIGDLSRAELSLSDSVAWVFITAPGLSARYAMATINPEAVD